ncbi:Proline iminopeptidase [Thalassocella blandensis]|nr:Proline iminopeptidase [Thalassocella blandensis]
MTAMEEHWVKVPGGAIYVKRWLPANASCGETQHNTPLILLHDSLGCVALWRDFPAMLAEHLSRPVVAYDRLGFGLSEARNAPLPYDFIEEEALKFFPYVKDQLGFGQFLLLGYSVGGAMAVNIAARDEACQAVITLSAQAFVEAKTLQGIRNAALLFQEPEQVTRLSKWHGAKSDWVLHAWTDTWLSPEFAHWNLQQALQSLNCPLLAIHGDRDEYGSIAFPQFIAQHAADFSDIHILKNCGHMPLKKHSAEVIDALTVFLTRTSLLN